MNSQDYIGNGEKFEPWSRRGFLEIQALDFLIGKPWDDVALGFVHGLRPSVIRAVHDGAQADSMAWRVTVWLGDDNRIASISQEVEVGLPVDIAHGGALRKATIGRERSVV